MPRKIEYYECMLCSEKYKSRKEATKCEKSHLVPTGVSKPLYCRDDRKNKFPDSVLVELSDGSTVRYYRKEGGYCGV